MMVNIIDIVASYRATFYHGTQRKYLPKIMREGLRPFGGGQTGGNTEFARGRAVYLTAAFDRAARYSLGLSSLKGSQKEAIILELTLSGNKRFRPSRLTIDPLDQLMDTKGYQSYDDDNRSVYTFEVELTHEIHNWLTTTTKGRDLAKNLKYRTIDFREDSLEDLHGINIQKSIAKYFIKYIRLAKNDAMLWARRVVDYIRKKHGFEYFDITPSYTLRMSDSYWTEIEQVKYRMRIPPKAIKYIWVHGSHPKAVATQGSPIPMLPHEAENLIDEIKEVFGGIVDADDSNSVKDKAMWLKSHLTERGLKDSPTFREGYKDMMRILQKASVGVYLHEEANDIVEWMMELYEDHVYLSDASWSKIRPRDV